MQGHCRFSLLNHDSISFCSNEADVGVNKMSKKTFGTVCNMDHSQTTGKRLAECLNNDSPQADDSLHVTRDSPLHIVVLHSFQVRTTPKAFDGNTPLNSRLTTITKQVGLGNS